MPFTVSDQLCRVHHSGIGSGPMADLIWALISRNDDDETAVRGFLVLGGILKVIVSARSKTGCVRWGEAVRTA